MSCGGLWDKEPRGFMESQIDSLIGHGIHKDAAWRYARALQFGGCTTAEAMEIIRDKACGHLGFGFELCDLDYIPEDRWFRDAWKRSHNGGPISIDLVKAKPIHFSRVISAIELENKRRKKDLDLYGNPVDGDLDKIAGQIRAARDELELRLIWPKELNETELRARP
jgi:hypothetical protein